MEAVNKETSLLFLPTTAIYDKLGQMIGKDPINIDDHIETLLYMALSKLNILTLVLPVITIKEI